MLCRLPNPPPSSLLNQRNPYCSTSFCILAFLDLLTKLRFSCCACCSSFFLLQSILIGASEISHDNAQYKEYDELLEAALQKARDVKSKFAGTIENFDELVGNVL